MLAEQSMTPSSVACHVCGAKQLSEFTNYPSLPRVASDCVPWQSGGKLAICNQCNCVQNPIDSSWHNETARIYSTYKLYRQSAGSEQGVFSENKQVMPRSAKVFQQAAPFLKLNETGYLLDIGCANGELLRCFHTIAPHWKMVGFEIDDKRREEVEKISGVEMFASGSLDKLDKQFDIITLIHVFEHLPNPTQWLENLKRILTADGIVIIQVPDPKTNPYNLLVADHCSHFLMSDLINIANCAGYDIITHSDTWVARELSILIKPKASTSINTNTYHQSSASIYPQKSLEWLHEILSNIKSFPKDKPRGIWGTAIAATWLYSLLEKNVDFFVDEDTTRVGQEHLGKPIYSPEMIPAGSNVFIALTPEIADKIVNRWSKLDVTLYTPPSLIY